MWRRAGALAALCALALGGAAAAHIVYGTRTLRALVAEADLVLHARIRSTGERVGVSTEAGGLSRPFVEAQVLEVLKGSLDAERVRFAQHGHGVAPFREGEETLLFLLPIERSRELAQVARSGALRWVSLQEHDETYPLRAETRGVLLSAVADYVSASGADGPEAAYARLRRATLSLLTSGDADLAASALRDLVLAPEAPLVRREDLPRLVPVLEDAGVAMGVRVALLTELSRRGLLDGEARWQQLLAFPDATPVRDRITAIRAAGTSGGPAVRPRLVELLGSADPDVAAAAADALGRARDPASVGPLSAALTHGEKKVRMAAIRSLGRIATSAADQALRQAAGSHADPDTRRRARSELAKRELDGG